TITRHTSDAITHVHATPTDGPMVGAGYAPAEDRLILMDILRRVGRGVPSSCAAAAESLRGVEKDLRSTAAHTVGDKRAQLDRVAAEGERGAQALEDVDSYLEVIHAYIDEADNDRNFPGEYVLTGHKDAITIAGEIERFTATDVVGIASMVGGIFGGGGGGEVQSALVRANFQDRYGAEEGLELYESWRMENDPEASTTVDGDCPYSPPPEEPVGEAVPGPGSVEP